MRSFALSLFALSLRALYKKNDGANRSIVALKVKNDKSDSLFFRKGFAPFLIEN